jgi:hypothetical protein
MSVAPKLPPLPDADPNHAATHDAGPRLDVELVNAEAAAERPGTQPPLPAGKSGKPRRESRIPQVVLVLFVVGLVAFALGVALAATVVLGELDLNSGWLKDVLDTLKDLAKHKRG